MSDDIIARIGRKPLPAKPDGYKKRTEMHMSMSDKKHGRYGMAVYTIIDPNGEVVDGLTHEYNSHPVDGYQGFFIDRKGEPFTTWASLVEAWNASIGAKGVE